MKRRTEIALLDGNPSAAVVCGCWSGPHLDLPTAVALTE
jgi:hypothetical protein